MVYSTNLARQFYVMKGVKQTSDAPTTTNTIQLVTTDPNAPYIVAMGAVGTLRSDLLTNIECVKITDAAALAKSLKSVKVVLDSAVVAGQDYILKIEFSQFAGISDEEKYFKYGMVHGTTGMTASNFYKELALSLAKNFSRELSKLVEIKIHETSGNTTTTVTPTTSLLDTDYDYILINEADQTPEWRLGVKAATPVYFNVTTGTIKVSGDELLWGTVTSSDSTKDNHGNTVSPISAAGSVGNGTSIADLEYFLMGERGDIYRKIGWPNNIDTKYLVDPTTTYDVLDVHYSYVGSNEGVLKSEKDLVIVTPHANATNLATLANDIAKAQGFANYKKVGSTGAVSDVTVV